MALSTPEDGAEALLAYVNGGDSHRDFAGECWLEAQALVSVYVGAADVPKAVLRRAVLEVASELFHRRSAPSGIAQFASEQGAQPVRIARDPMLGAYSMLNRYVALGAA